MILINATNGQHIELDRALTDEILDLNGKSIKFNRIEGIKNDIVYSGNGSDGKTYQLSLKYKTMIISIFKTPELDPPTPTPTPTPTPSPMVEKEKEEENKNIIYTKQKQKLKESKK